MPHKLAREKARIQYDAAFHLLHVTYPLVRDPKLLKGIVTNIAKSMEHGMDAVLAYERQLKLVPHHNTDFQSKFNIFRLKSVKRNKINQEHINLMQNLKELQELQKKCPTEFQRGNKYVLATDNYQLKVISMNTLKEYVQQNKEFLEKIDHILHL